MASQAPSPRHCFEGSLSLYHLYCEKRVDTRDETGRTNLTLTLRPYYITTCSIYNISPNQSKWLLLLALVPCFVLNSACQLFKWYYYRKFYSLFLVSVFCQPCTGCTSYNSAGLRQDLKWAYPQPRARRGRGIAHDIMKAIPQQSWYYSSTRTSDRHKAHTQMLNSTHCMTLPRLSSFFAANQQR